MIWSDWRVYAVAAAVTVAGLFYNCNKRVEMHQSWQVADVAVVKEEKAAGKKFTSYAQGIYDSSLARMERSGARFSRKQLDALLYCADVDKNGKIDDNEVRELEIWLDPDTLNGRLALPYDGRSDLPVVSDPKKWEPYLMSLVDEDGNNVITSDEVRRNAGKLELLLGGRK